MQNIAKLKLDEKAVSGSRQKAINLCKRVNERGHKNPESLLVEAALRTRRNNERFKDNQKAERAMKEAIESM